MRGAARPPTNTLRGDGATPLADAADTTTTTAQILSDAAEAPDTPSGDPSVSSRRANREVEALLPGRVHDTPHGNCFVVEWRYPLDHSHGFARLGAIVETPLDSAGPLLSRHRDERIRLLTADPRRMIYLDTETTGLAGGTGTYAFLIGIGRFVGDEFVVRQMFMRDLHEEHAALHVLAREMAGYEALV